MNRVPARVWFAALTLGLALASFVCILTALHAVGTDAALYYREQVSAGILPASGLSDEGLRELDGALARYLAGDGAALGDGAGGVIRADVFGVEQPAFNEREMAHMRDCADLFALLRGVRRRLIPWAILLSVGGAYLLANRRRARCAAWLSSALLLVPLAAFAAWAAVDFDAAFTFFHRMLFTNDLWLLDPRTDLLIRVCPAEMFMHMGLRIGAWSLAALIGVPTAATALSIFWPKQRGESTWNNRDMRRSSGQKQMTFGGGAKR